ncbi:hypothetical protein Fmac_024366 [Flemingia macrophylla]|uniref:Uncharacterized protein n=1 Tax=Flemingia macrophylla TaxID=520843 RepID=A0ABD1LPQ0_9FABA
MQSTNVYGCGHFARMLTAYSYTPTSLTKSIDLAGKKWYTNLAPDGIHSKTHWLTCFSESTKIIRY